MKIVFFISSLRAGGAERVATLLMNQWVDQTAQIVLVTFDTEKGDFFQVDPRIQRYCIGYFKTGLHFFKKIYQNGKRILRALQIIQKEKPDIVLSFMIDMNVLACCLKFFIKTPVILSERTYVPYYVKGGILKKILPFLYKKADIYVVQTQQGADWAKTFLPSQKIKVLPNPVMSSSITDSAVPVSPLTPSSVSVGQQIGQDNQPIILAVGRLVEEKGFDRLIQVCAGCLNTYKDWQLWIVGEGPERSNLEKQIHDLNMEDRIFLKGRCQNVTSFYVQASIFVLSSKVEGFPNVLLEAMAHGLAVISVDCLTGPRDIICDHYNGLLIDMTDAAMEQALKQLIENKALRLQLGQNARQVQDKYALNKVAQQWIALFQQILH